MTRIAINKKRLLQIVPLGYTSIWELERAGAGGSESTETAGTFAGRLHRYPWTGQHGRRYGLFAGGRMAA